VADGGKLQGLALSPGKVSMAKSKGES